MGIEIKGECRGLVVFILDMPMLRRQCDVCGVKVMAGVCTGFNENGEASINWQNMTIYHESRCGIEEALKRRVTVTTGQKE